MRTYDDSPYSPGGPPPPGLAPPGLTHPGQQQQSPTDIDAINAYRMGSATAMVPYTPPTAIWSDRHSAFAPIRGNNMDVNNSGRYTMAANNFGVHTTGVNMGGDYQVGTSRPGDYFSYMDNTAVNNTDVNNGDSSGGFYSGAARPALDLTRINNVGSPYYSPRLALNDDNLHATPVYSNDGQLIHFDDFSTQPPATTLAYNPTPAYTQDYDEGHVSRAGVGVVVSSAMQNRDASFNRTPLSRFQRNIIMESAVDQGGTANMAMGNASLGANPHAIQGFQTPAAGSAGTSGMGSAISGSGGGPGFGRLSHNARAQSFNMMEYGSVSQQVPAEMRPPQRCGPITDGNIQGVQYGVERLWSDLTQCSVNQGYDHSRRFRRFAEWSEESFLKIQQCIDEGRITFHQAMDAQDMQSLNVWRCDLEDKMRRMYNLLGSYRDHLGGWKEACLNINHLDAEIAAEEYALFNRYTELEGGVRDDTELGRAVSNAIEVWNDNIRKRETDIRHIEESVDDFITSLHAHDWRGKDTVKYDSMGPLSIKLESEEPIGTTENIKDVLGKEENVKEAIMFGEGDVTVMGALLSCPYRTINITLECEDTHAREIRERDERIVEMSMEIFNKDAIIMELEGKILKRDSCFRELSQRQQQLEFSQDRAEEEHKLLQRRYEGLEDYLHKEFLKRDLYPAEFQEKFRSTEAQLQELREDTIGGSTHMEEIRRDRDVHKANFERLKPIARDLKSAIGASTHSYEFIVGKLMMELRNKGVHIPIPELSRELKDRVAELMAKSFPFTQTIKEAMKTRKE